MKIFKQLIINSFILTFFLSFFAHPLFAQEVARDNFDEGISSNWVNNGSVQSESHICGPSGCNSVKMTHTTTTVYNGRLFRSFLVNQGATYQISVAAGVYTNGASPDGTVTLIATDGNNSTISSNCTNSSCTASGSTINGSLSVTITPQTGTLTVYLDGAEGGCTDTSCHDPYIDDFSLTQISSADSGGITVDHTYTNNQTSQAKSSLVLHNNYSTPVTINFPHNQFYYCDTSYGQGGMCQENGRVEYPPDVTIPAGGAYNAGEISQYNGGSSPGDCGSSAVEWYWQRADGKSEPEANRVYWGYAYAGTDCSGTRHRPLKATCSVSKNTADNSVTWTALAQDGIKPYTAYSWNFGPGYSCVSPSTNCISDANPTVKYATGGTKSGSVTVTDTDSTSASSTNTCQVVLNQGEDCTLSANPSSGQPPLTTTFTVSPSSIVTSRNARTELAINYGDGQSTGTHTNDYSDSHRYSTAGNYIATFTATNRNDPKENHTCSTGVVVSSTPTPPAGGGDTCDPDSNPRVSGCTSSVNRPACSLVGGAPTNWCIQNVGPDRVCQYCPPVAGPPPCRIIEPPNDAPTVTLSPNGHTVNIVYQYAAPGYGGDEYVYNPTSSNLANSQNPLKRILALVKKLFVKPAFGQVGVPDITGHIFRSNSRGFINSSGIAKTEIGTTFGTGGGLAFDTQPPQRSIVYYQAQSSSGLDSQNSGTYGIVTSQNGYRNACQKTMAYSVPALISAQQVPGTRTSTTVTFDLNYSVPTYYNGCGPYCYATYYPKFLQIQQSSASSPSYIPWINANENNHTCLQRDYRSYTGCFLSKWTARYTIDLPPGTSERLSITGYQGPNQCDNENSRGTVSLDVATDAGSPPAVVAPGISASSYQQTPWGYDVVPVSTGNTQPGQIGTVYRSGTDNPNSGTRWDGNELTTRRTYEEGKWVFRATDDLTDVPAGRTYWYGAKLDVYGIVGNCSSRDIQSNQAGFYWDYSPWVKTTTGDIHSNSGLNTPGGP